MGWKQSKVDRVDGWSLSKVIVYIYWMSDGRLSSHKNVYEWNNETGEIDKDIVGLSSTKRCHVPCEGVTLGKLTTVSAHSFRR